MGRWKSRFLLQALGVRQDPRNQNHKTAPSRHKVRRRSRRSKKKRRKYRKIKQSGSKTRHQLQVWLKTVGEGFFGRFRSKFGPVLRVCVSLTLIGWCPRAVSPPGCSQLTGISARTFRTIRRPSAITKHIRTPGCCTDRRRGRDVVY